jgi:hypothetical protein
MKKQHLLMGGAVVAALTVAFFVGDADEAEAFPFMNSWHMSSAGETNNNQNRAGAEGIYGTGGPGEYNIQCAHCHVDAEGLITAQIVASPAFGTSGNDSSYAPGQAYDITVTMMGEHKMTMSNLNGFVATFEDASGQVMGSLNDDNGNSSTNCPAQEPAMNPPNTTFMYGDCHGILFVPNEDVTTWQFQWVAPAAGAGDVTMWWGMTDGDTAGESSLDDDTIQGNIPLIEG